MKLQVESLHTSYDNLQKIYGDSRLTAVYGAGKIEAPKAMLLFMNPTGRNVSAYPNWKGIKAPWIGTKNIWKLIYQIGGISLDTYSEIQKLKPILWNPDFSELVYTDVADRDLYITNLAKCTQIDARPLPNSTFLNYRALVLQEIAILKPKMIITFGNQVSSILLSKKISVTKYHCNYLSKEILKFEGNEYDVYPTLYPVGQGQRNMPLSVERIQGILGSII